jgi:hypothetical protein
VSLERLKLSLDDKLERKEKTAVLVSAEKIIKESIVKHQKFRRVSVIAGFIVSTAMLSALFAFPSAEAQENATGIEVIPPGTILPVRLNETLSSSKSQPGQVITARIMQDVPLPNGGKIREGSKVVGHVVGVSSAADNNGDQVSLQFDKVISSGRAIPVKTHLRAVAGFMDVMEAEIPADGAVAIPIATTQVGGDTAYTSGGKVTSDSTVVGKSVRGGALDQAHAGNRQGRECRGAVDDNNNPQAMWVFSSDSCGTYGLSEIRIAHAGKTQPVGVVVFVSAKGQLKLPGGAGMLLRVQE